MLTDDRLRSFLDLVEESVREPGLDGEGVAARAYLSRHHLDRIARAATGEPLGAMRRRLRLELAAYRLTGTGSSVIDVALDAGYGSPEAFTRAFARAYGVPPSTFRGLRRPQHDLDCASGIHIHPPGGLRLPAPTPGDPMDVIVAMTEHHLDTTRAILDRLDQVLADVLDAPVTLSVEGIDEDPTLRTLATRLVTQLEMWVGAVEGATAMPSDGTTTPEALRARLEVAGERFRELVVEPVRRGEADTTFVDAVCEPPETFTLGGVLAHVLTFAAVRRTLAIGALTSAGVTDLGSGDPMHAVGAHGSDASTISPRRV